MSRKADLSANLPQLQNLIKRDPESYKEDFEQQYRFFQSSLQVFFLLHDLTDTLLENHRAYVTQCHRIL